MVLANVPAAPVSFPVGWALSGMGQWLILRRRIRGAGWWVLAVPIAWLQGAVIGQGSFGIGLGWVASLVLVVLVATVVAGLLGGVVLLLLLAAPAEEGRRDWRLLWQWAIATLLGGLLGEQLGTAAFGIWGTEAVMSSAVYNLGVGFCTGLLLGLGQWLLLRPRLFRWPWVLVSALGAAVGAVVPPRIGLSGWTWGWGGLWVPGLVFFGVALGLGQWLLLRRRAQETGWWVLVSWVAWSMGGVMYDALLYFGLGLFGQGPGWLAILLPILAMAIPSLLTGAALALLRPIDLRLFKVTAPQ